MRFIVFLFLVGCSGNQELYIDIKNNCEPLCQSYSETWNGLIRVTSDKVTCVCEGVN